MSDKKEKGQEAEQRALLFLQQQGLKLLQRNYSCRLGEIDLIMRDCESIVFVEVRYRHNSAFGRPIESIVYSKQQRIIRSAFYYLRQHQKTSSMNYRFDVVGVTEKWDFEWIQNAFEVNDFHI